MCNSCKKEWPFWWRAITAAGLVSIIYIISGMNTGAPEAYIKWMRVLSLVAILNVLLKKFKSSTCLWRGYAIFGVLYPRILLAEPVRPQFTNFDRHNK